MIKIVVFAYNEINIEWRVQRGEGGSARGARAPL